MQNSSAMCTTYLVEWMSGVKLAESLLILQLVNLWLIHLESPFQYNDVRIINIDFCIATVGVYVYCRLGYFCR